MHLSSIIHLLAWPWHLLVLSCQVAMWNAAAPRHGHMAVLSPLDVPCIPPGPRPCRETCWHPIPAVHSGLNNGRLLGISALIHQLLPHWWLPPLFPPLFPPAGAPHHVVVPLAMMLGWLLSQSHASLWMCLITQVLSHPCSKLSPWQCVYIYFHLYIDLHIYKCVFVHLSGVQYACLWSPQDCLPFIPCRENPHVWRQGLNGHSPALSFSVHVGVIPWAAWHRRDCTTIALTWHRPTACRALAMSSVWGLPIRWPCCLNPLPASKPQSAK